jgi:D-psicose/D-tagatose/L-ribulose 3-epimerase
LTRKIGIHLSFWQKTWSDDLLPLIQLAKQAGFDGVEIPLLDPDNLDLNAIQETMALSQLAATCGTGLTQDTDITHPDPDVRQAGLSFLGTCIQAASRLGSPILAGVIYSPWSFFPTGDLDEYRERCIQSLQQATRIASEFEVTLCMEILNRFEGFICNTVEQGVQILKEVNSPYLKLHLDTFHLNIEENDIAGAIRSAGIHLGHFHASENNRRRPGMGHIPWAEIRLALDEIGYTGWVVMESFVRPEGEVGRTLSIWQPLVDDLQDEARAGATFLRDMLTGA